MNNILAKIVVLFLVFDANLLHAGASCSCQKSCHGDTKQQQTTATSSHQEIPRLPDDVLKKILSLALVDESADKIDIPKATKLMRVNKQFHQITIPILQSYYRSKLSCLSLTNTSCSLKAISKILKGYPCLDELTIDLDFFDRDINYEKREKQAIKAFDAIIQASLACPPQWKNLKTLLIATIASKRGTFKQLIDAYSSSLEKLYLQETHHFYGSDPICLDFKAMATCKNLKHLQIHGRSARSWDYSHITCLPNLEVLVLMQHSIPLDDLFFILRNSPRLSRVEIRHYGEPFARTKEDFQNYLSKLPPLWTAELNPPIEIQARIQPPERMPDYCFMSASEWLYDHHDDGLLDWTLILTKSTEGNESRSCIA